jgi:hypothetical protein
MRGLRPCTHESRLGQSLAAANDVCELRTNAQALFCHQPTTAPYFDPEKVYQAYAIGQSFKELQPAIRAGNFLPDSIPSIGLPISVNTGPSVPTL